MNRLLPILAAATLALDAEAKTLLITNAVIHTVTGPVIEKGQVLVTDGVITTVTNSDPSLEAEQTINLEGLRLYPGLIAASTSLGLIEIDAVRATRDTAEVGPFTPEVQSWLAVNPDSELIPVARANGVTHAVSVPSGGVIAGQSGVIQLSGWSIEDLAYKTPAAVHLFWPSMALDISSRRGNRAGPGQPEKKSLQTQSRERRERIREIENFFAEAEAYAAGERSDSFKDPAWEGMLPLLRGDIPLVIHADEIREIRAALAFVKDRKFRVIIAGGREAWRFAEELAKAKISVIYERIYKDGNNLAASAARDTEGYDVNFRAPSILAKAGVKFAIGEGLGGDAASDIRNIPYVTAQAIAFGLDPAEALKAITLYPAEMFGLEKLGAIAEGKDATFFAISGDVFDIRANVKKLWIKGDEIDLSTRHTRLYERYKSRPKPQP